MHPTAQRFAEEILERHGIDADIHEFPEGTKTAAAAAEAVGCDVAQIGSSLVFVAGEGEPVIVITSGANRVSEGRLADHLGVEAVRMADADEVREATGWSIGGVPPVCHAQELPVLLDETLLDHETVWVAAGTPAAVWSINPDRLVDLAGATPADVAE